MIITMWVLFVFFSILAFFLIINLFSKRLNWLEILVLLFSVFVVAISAGFIWGGLTL